VTIIAMWRCHYYTIKQYLGRKMKGKAVRVGMLCVLSSFSDKGGKLVLTLSFNELTILEDSSAACGVVLRRYCCSS
jgi:hypothetical protein